MAGEVELERMVVRLIGDAQQYQQMIRDSVQSTRQGVAEVEKVVTGIERTQQQFEQLGRTLQSVGGRIAMVGAGLTAAITLPVTMMGRKFIHAATEAEEVQSKFEVVFSGVAQQAGQMADELNRSYGLSGTAARKLMSDTGDLLTGFGFTRKEALDLSSQVQTLAVDLASFTNIEGGAERASLALTRGLLGERESMKLLGIAINQNTDEWKQMVAEVEATTGATGMQAKALATLRLAQRQSTNALGDFGRTSSSVANATRTLRASIDDLIDEMGALLLPTVRLVLGAISQLMDWFKSLSPEIKMTIMVVAGLAAAIGPLLAGIGGLVAMAGFAVSGLGALIPVVAFLVSPIGLLVAGVATLTAGLTALGVWLASQGVFDDLIAEAKILWTEFRENVTPTLKEMGRIVKEELWPAIKDLTGAMKDLMASDGPMMQFIKIGAKVELAKLEYGLRALSFGFKVLAVQMQTVVAAGRALGIIGPKAAGAAPVAAPGGVPVTAPEAVTQELGAAPDTGSLEDTLQNLRDQIHLFDMTKDQIQIYRLEMEAANLALTDPAAAAAMRERIDRVEGLQRGLESLRREQEQQQRAQQEAQELMAQGRQLIEQYMTPLEQYQKRMEDITHLRMVGAIDEETLRRAMEDAERVLAESELRLPIHFEAIQAAARGSAEAEFRIAEHRARVGGAMTPREASPMERRQAEGNRILNRIDEHLRLVVANTGEQAEPIEIQNLGMG